MRHCYVVRVFTVGDSGGNPLGVIPDATGLTDPAMQHIATDLGFSETVFIEWPPGGVPELRIFTPAVELPFAGHPLVGTAWILNRLGPGTDRMRIRIGEIGIHFDDADESLVWVTVPDTDRRASEVGVESVREGLGVEGAAAWRVEVPSEYLVVQLPSEEELVAARPDMEAVAAATEGLYLFSGSDPVRSRFFAPRLGVDEDPATGSAAVALTAVLAASGATTGTARIVQGMPDALSELHVRWAGGRVELGGSVVGDEIRILDD